MTGVDYEQVLQRLQELEASNQTLQQEIEDNRYVLPPRFLTPVKKSSVLIKHLDGEPCGVGFFVSATVVITANHNLKTYNARAQSVNVKLFNNAGQFVNSTLSIKFRSTDYDLAVLTSASDHESFFNNKPR